MTDDLPTVARFALGGSAPPKLTVCLHLAERVHLALVRLSDGAEVFTGCDSSADPCRGTATPTSFASAIPSRDGHG